MPTGEDDYVNKIPYYIMLKLSKALDAGDKWQDLLAAIDEAELDGPPLEPDYVYVLDNCFKQRQSPTEKLLNELGVKGYNVRDLKHWLHLAGLKQALDLLEVGNSTTSSTSVSSSPYRGSRSASYSGTKKNCPPVVHRVTTPTEGRAGFGSGGTIQPYSETRRRRTEEYTCSMSHENWPTQGITKQITSNSFDHPHFGQIPSDIGLTQVVSIIGAEYEQLAVLLGIPRTHAVVQSGSLKGLDTLVYWRNGKSGLDFPTTWKFLLLKVEEVCGAGVARDIEKALISKPTWCNSV